MGIRPYETGQYVSNNLVGERHKHVVPQYSRNRVTSLHQFKQSRFSVGLVVFTNIGGRRDTELCCELGAIVRSSCCPGAWADGSLSPRFVL